jgi:hypothetical protein
MLERLKHGYKAESFELNLALSNRFQNLHKKYSKNNEVAMYSSGIAVFWEWVTKLWLTEER